MLNRVIVGVVAVLIACLPAPAAVPQCAQDILAKSKHAMGGDAWDGIRTTYSKVKIVTSGLTGEGESWQDNLSGKYLGVCRE